MKIFLLVFLSLFVFSCDPHYGDWEYHKKTEEQKKESRKEFYKEEMKMFDIIVMPFVVLVIIVGGAVMLKEIHKAGGLNAFLKSKEYEKKIKEKQVDADYVIRMGNIDYLVKMAEKNGEYDVKWKDYLMTKNDLELEKMKADIDLVRKGNAEDAQKLAQAEKLKREAEKLAKEAEKIEQEVRLAKHNVDEEIKESKK
jgi:uncharacterized protein YxeA